MSMPSIPEVLQRLEAGNARFVADKPHNAGRDHQRRSELTTGQKPWCIVLTCADSRVSPELAFDTGLGELFTICVAGNIANTSSIASIEYAVAHIGTPVVVVLGHQSCGAVTAAIGGGDHGYNLNHLLAHIEPAKARCPDGDVEDTVRANAVVTAHELVNRSAIIKKAVDEGFCRVVPAYYKLSDGTVNWLE